MRDHPTLWRQWRLLETLGERPGSGWSHAELAARFAVDERTIRRDLRLWERLGVQFERTAPPNAPHRFALLCPARIPAREL